MTAVAKRQNHLAPASRWALLVYALVLSLLLLGYASSQYRQYRYYMALEQQTTSVVDALHQLQHKVLSNNESSKQLNNKIVALSLAASGFVQFIYQDNRPQKDLNGLVTLLEQYQKNLQTLQDANIRSRYALSAFADKVQALTPSQSSDSYQALLQRSQLYINATDPLFLYMLDEYANRLQQNLDDNQQGGLYFFQIYRQNLEQLVQQRYALTVDDSSELLSRRSHWQQQAKDSWQGVMLALFLVLLLYFGLGFIWLALQNRRLRAASQTALTLARAKTDFLANMSHEIRTPMNAIIGFASLMQQMPLTMQQLQYLNKIKTSSDNLLLLINDILDLTKVEAGKLELEDIEFDLNDQLDRLSGLFSDMSEHKQLEVIIMKDAAVPASLRGDPLRLGQVLVNLVNNAVKFTERGEVVLNVSISHEPEPRLCFVISDTGIGIAPEQLDQLFHSFMQVDASTTRKYGGSGLGLSITHHLVQLMQGTIRVSSQPGRGSCFTVSLPLHPATVARPEMSAYFQGKAVLLVDDNQLVIEVLSQLLSQFGMIVYSAPSMQSAKEILLKRGPELDLALIDCCLGQDNGLDLARYMHQQAHLSHIKLVITSAFGQDRPAEKMRSLGLTHYLSKPITEHSLWHCLQQLFECAPDDHKATLGSNILDLSYYQHQLIGKQILLAEDNRMNQQLIVEFLKQVSVSITLADNGRQAVELTSKHNFDAILMDLQMPILDGIEATRQIRKLNINHNIPIVALTASAMRGDRETSLAAGMNSYVTKPVNRFDLYQALIQVLTPPATVVLTKNTLSSTQAEPSSLENQMEHQLESQRAKQRQFIEQHQDVGWLLQAFVAAENWSQAQQLMNTLAEEANACDLLLLIEPIHSLIQPLERAKRPSPEQISTLNQRLAEIKHDLKPSA